MGKVKDFDGADGERALPSAGTADETNDTGIVSHADPIAAEINAEHDAAWRKTGEVYEHARRAGELLLQKKAELGHGRFLTWLAAHCKFSERQAQRYMRRARGEDRIEAKSDTVSVLDGAIAVLEDPREGEYAAVVPPPLGSDFDTHWEWIGRQFEAPLNQWDLDFPCLIAAKIHKQIGLDGCAAFVMEQFEEDHSLLRCAAEDHLVCAFEAYADILNGKQSLSFCRALSSVSLQWLLTRTTLFARRGIGAILHELDERRIRYKRDDGRRLSADRAKAIDDFLAKCDAQLTALVPS